MHCRELISVADLFIHGTRRVRGCHTRAQGGARAGSGAAATMVTNGGGTPNRYDDYVWMHNTVGSRAHFGLGIRALAPRIPATIRIRSQAGLGKRRHRHSVLGLDDGSRVRRSQLAVHPGPYRRFGRCERARDGRAVLGSRDLADEHSAHGDPNTQLRRRPANVGAGFNLPTAINARNGAAYPQPYDASPFNEVFTNATPTSTIQGWINGSFRKFLEWVLHNGVHTWVGGQDNGDLGGPMSFPPVAVNDPVFWLHHCNIDRIWTIWQQRRSNQNLPAGHRR